ncbi:MAG: hypothetical protein H6736_09760 [Alphaproteobacteria bacterium]|nr:hypothetical protein [Alphaproteobacteria bacterium]
MRTVIPAVLTCALLFATPAHARSVKWLAKGATVEIQGPVDVPLYRGDYGGHRPLVRIETPGKSAPRADLAVVDIAHGWTRIGWKTVRQLGLVPEETSLQGRYAQVVVLPEVRIGDLVIRDLRAQVDDSEVPVLGLAAIPGLATAILASEGKVRFVPASQGRELVQGVGEALEIRRQTAGTWKAGSEKEHGNGMALSTPGALSGEDGWLQLRTDVSTTHATPAYDDNRVRRRGGELHLRGRGRIGEVELAESWVVRDGSLSDKAEGLVGALGYDQLYAVDLAVSPSHGLVAVKEAFQPKWERAEAVRLEVAKAAHTAAGLPSADERVDRPPKIGFDKGGPEADPKGDPGDPSTLRLERDLAVALWDVGDLDAAIPFFLRASEAAGDHCGPHMELGLKRLAWSGSMQQQKFIVELIRQPLRQAGELWDRWDALDPKTREAVRKGKDVATDVFQIEQESRCLTAWGTLMAAYVAQGNTAESSAIYKDHYGRDPLVAFAQGLSLLEQGQAKTAEIPIREALSFDVAEKGDIKLGLGRAQAVQGLREPVLELVKEVPALELDHGLAAAMIALEWGRMLDGDEGPAEMARRLVKADPFWIPAQLVAIWRGVEEADATQLRAELVRQQGRDAGSTEVEVYRAVLQALEGQGAEARKALRTLQKSRPPTPDLFAALALVASINGRLDRVEENLLELRLRYPAMPFDDLDLPRAPAEPEPTAP